MLRFCLVLGVLVTLCMLHEKVTDAAPVVPSNPVAGWLYDETYSGFGSTITDSFGTMNGLTAFGGTSTTTVAPGGPVTSSDTPFSYAGNSSFSTVGGPGSNVWHGTFGVGSYSSLVNGASAVTVSAWLKYADGALTTVGNNNQNNNANGFFGMTIHGPAGGSGFYLNLPTGTAPDSSSNLNKLLVGGTSTSSDTFQSFVTAGVLTPGAWNHIVAVLDFANDQIRVSLNGGAFETGVASFGASTLTPGTLGTVPDIIPSRSNNSEFIGLLDEVAIWKGALSHDNVLWLNQNSLHAIPEPGSFYLSFIGISVLAGSRMRSIARRRSMGS